MCGRSLRGNREISRLATGESRVVRIGKARAEADDARRGEVGLCRSSWEAGEGRRCRGDRAEGAKGGGRGERGPGRHAPDTGTGERVPRAGARADSREAEEGGEVHGTAPPRRRGPAAVCLSGAAAGCGGGGGRGDVAGVRRRGSRAASDDPQGPSPPRRLSGAAVAAGLHPEARRTATATR